MTACTYKCPRELVVSSAANAPTPLHYRSSLIDDDDDDRQLLSRREGAAAVSMAVKQQGSSRQQQQHDVKVKFIETQFISSDAASFKAVVQQLTGKSSSHAPAPQRPRPCRPAFFPDDVAGAGAQRDGYTWAHQQQLSGNNGHHLIMPAPKQEPQRLEELYELCDFSDLLYGGGGGFPN